MQAKEVMTRKIVHVTPEETLNDAWMLMKHFDIRHILVIHEGDLVGIVSDRDVLRHAETIGHITDVPNIPVTEVMSQDLLTCEVSNTISDIASTMYHNKIDALPVLDREGELHGVITSSDLLSLLFSNPSGETLLSDLPFFFELVDWKVYRQEMPRASA